VYCNFSNKGRAVREVIERHQPDLLVVALQESYLKNFLLRMKKLWDRADRKGKKNESESAE